MQLFTFDGSLSRGITVESVKPKEGSEYPAVVLGGGQYGAGTQRWVAVQRAAAGRLLGARIGTAAKSGRPVLIADVDADDSAVLVRINTNAGYTRDTFGRWAVVAGQPETVVSTASPTNSLARLGTFADGLVVMRSGDVLKVTFSSRGRDAAALFFDAQGQLATAPFEEWEAGRKAEAAGAAVRFGSMPAYSFGHLGHGQGWGVTRGIPTAPMAGGRGFKLGPLEGGWRIESWVTVMAVGLPELVTNAAVAGDKTPVLVQADQVEMGKFLVRVDTDGLRKGGRTGASVYSGSPTLLARGQMEIGNTNVKAHYDELWVVGEKDVLRIGQTWEDEVAYTDYILFVKDGEVKAERIYPWMLAKGKTDPGFFVREKNLAPLPNVPADWTGRVVSIHRFVDEVDNRRVVGLTLEPVWFDGGQFGELISTKPLVVNTGWDGKDWHTEEVWVGREPVWVQLHPDKQVRRLQGEAAQQRSDGRSRASELVAELEATRSLSYFRYARMDFSRLLEESRLFDTAGIDGIEGWIRQAERELATFEAKRADAIELERRVNIGEILFDWSVWHRRGGVANLGDGWVIRPDGSKRPADSNDVRQHKSDGNFVWQLVENQELALLWQGSLTGEVAKLPVDGCTPAQLATVAEIEQELGLQPNAFGLNAEAEDEQAKLMAAIETACTKSGLLTSVPALEYHTVTSAEGHRTDDEAGHIRGKLKSLRQQLDQKNAALVQIQGRTGRLAKMMNVAGGTLQFIVFNKYGRENLAIRWLPPFEAMVFGALAQSDVLVRIPYISEEVLRGVTGFLTDESSFLYEVKLADLVDPAKGFKSVVTDYNGARKPAQVVERFAGETGQLQLLAHGEPAENRFRLCIRWRDNKPA